MFSCIPRPGRRLLAVSACVAVLATFAPPVSASQAVMLDPAPTVSALSPAAGSIAGGTTVTVSGTNLASARKVFFGDVEGTAITVVSATQLTVKSPPHTAATVDVRVQTWSSGTSPVVNADTFRFAGPPSVASILPSAGSVAGGQLVTVTGTNLSHAWKVAFGDVSGTGITLVSETRLTVRAPAHPAGRVVVRVTTAGGTSSIAAPVFTFAPVSALPTAPRAARVTVGGGIPLESATLNWSVPAGTGSSKITGYLVSRDGASSTGYGPWSAVLPATARSVTYNQLLPGVTYRFTVQAINSVGPGTEAAVTFKTTRRSLIYAIETAAHRVVPVDPNGAGVTPVGHGFIQPTQVLQDGHGNLVVLDRGAKQIIKISTTSGTQTRVGAALTDPSTIYLDTAGDIFAFDTPTPATWQIVRIDGATSQQTVVVSGVSGVSLYSWIAAGDGAVYVVRQDPAHWDIYLFARYAHGSGPVNIVRSWQYAYGTTAFASDPQGTVYFENEAMGGSGARIATSVAPDALTEGGVPFDFGTYHFAPLIGFDPTGNLYSPAPRAFCWSPAYMDGCVDDPIVDHLTKFTRSGAAVSIPVSRLRIPGYGAGPGLEIQQLTADQAGSIFVLGPDKVVVLAPNGGRPEVLATGAYISLSVR